VREDYAGLMRAFVQGTLTPAEFEADYLAKFKAERRELDEWTYRILDEVFGHVDAFCADDVLRQQLQKEHPGWHLSGEQLRAKVADALGRLEQ
jgi:hypothetical protein